MTDVSYWSLSMPLVPSKDLRPLLEAFQRLPEGGTASILYLLPLKSFWPDS